MESKIKFYEEEFHKFQPYKHFISRIREMEKKSSYGATLAMKWTEVVKQIVTRETYPAIHPTGQETFSLYVEFPTGIFEYALDIDGANSFIQENNIEPVKVSPISIMSSVDLGNINRDPNKIRPNHKNPIMIVQSQHLTDHKPYCVNGNHRIYEAYRNNDKSIEVFVFHELEFVPFFYNILSKATYFLEMDYMSVIGNKEDVTQSEEDAFVYKL
ncbi:hypothetical protein [Paenibacillus sp. MER 99-2]|uniref:hypothetical protein n=1 Tax=Paenibacillus sp. MER 99-2 TaxID=2939572 RepID=UPI00203E7D2E|nr:hypothetical protein [Paenibacillus sp. MER 99-2]MCM3173048.1 hypothetical protein [Paenibacillus sp. MER 99-2]